MCGIAAVFSYARRPAPDDRARLQRACDAMRCRGPDDAGIWSSDDARVLLGHQRLAILDLTARGAQPMQRGPIVISFNGEIYNFRELRRDLESRGHRFTSESDTEVLLALYARKGAAMVHDLRGMFAFAIWDESRRGLLLARDHFGIKPLYYSDDGECLRVASEVKALVLGGGVDTGPEPAGHAGFFVWGFVPEPYTLYRGIRALPAGHTMWVNEEGACPPQSYADVGTMLAEAEESSVERSPREAAEELRFALRDSVRHHLVADVPVGVFLSAGRDSTTLAALTAELGGRLRTVTLGFAEFRGTPHDETVLAEEVARRYGAEHHTVWITREEFLAERQRVIDRMDQPTIDGVNTYFVSRAAAGVGLKVALSGVGGDELFGGYPGFVQIPRLVSALGAVPGVRTLGRVLRFAGAPLARRVTSPKYASLLEYGTTYGDAFLLRRALFMPWELPSVLDRDLAREGWAALATRSTLAGIASAPRTGFRKVSALSASHYMRNQLLRDTDWASMSHSLEVRTPLVDWTLWRRVASLSVDRAPLGKAALAEAPIPPLPPAVLSRRKTGFTVPLHEWMLADRNVSAERGLRGWARYVYGRLVSSQHLGTPEARTRS